MRLPPNGFGRRRSAPRVRKQHGQRPGGRPGAHPRSVTRAVPSTCDGTGPLRRRVVLAAALLATASASAAQEGGLIRSGEHDGFSRIVMTIEPTTEWALETAADRATVFFPGRELAFRTDGLFVRMPRTRILGVRPVAGPRGTTVEVELGCDCRVSTRFVGARYLAVDVHDRNRPVPGHEAGIPAGRAPDPAAAEAAEAAGPTIAPDGLRSPDALATAERILVEQIARAADQGVIELAEAAGAPGVSFADAVTRPEPAQPEPEPPALPAADAEPPAAADPPAGLPLQDEQIAAITVYDRDGPRRGATQEPVPEECLDDDRLDIDRWSDGSPLHRQLPRLQGLLVGEFDRPDPVVVADIARLYIRFGFGAEAALMLESFDAAAEDAALLYDLARAVEGLPPAPGGPLAAAAPCPGRHGLWIAIAGARPPFRDADHFATVEAAFAELPPDLRDMLGPGLVTRLLDAGHPREAAVLQAIAVRPGLPPSVDARLAAAELAAAEGRTAEAKAEFAALFDADAHNAAAALLRLVHLDLAEPDPVPEARLTDLATAALAHRGEPLEVGLRTALAEALAHDSLLDKAIAELDLLMSDRPEHADGTRDTAVELLIAADPARIGAAQYAETVLAARDLLPGTGTYDPTRFAVARHLLALSLPNAALGLLDPSLARAQGYARELAARAYLERGDPADALGALDGLSGPDVARMRAEARVLAGDYPAAAQELAAAGLTGALAERAWPLGAWEQARGAGDPRRAAMAGYMLNRGATATPAPTSPETPEAAFATPLPPLERPSLGAARALLETGRQVGGFVETLLAEE
jgi:hypothetical protein